MNLTNFIVGVGFDVNKRQLDTSMGAIDQLASKAGKLTGLLAGGVGAKALALDLTNDIAQMERLSDLFGMTQTRIRAMGAVAKKEGGSLEAITDNMRSLFDIKNKEEFEYSAIFESVGKIAPIDPRIVLEANTAEEAFLNLSEAIEGLSEKKQRNILKQFGIADDATIRVMQKGRQEIENLVEEESKRRPISDKYADDAIKFQQNLVDVQNNLLGIGDAIASNLLPPMIKVTSVFNEFIEDNEAFIDGSIARVIKSAADDWERIATVLAAIAALKVGGKIAGIGAKALEVGREAQDELGDWSGRAGKSKGKGKRGGGKVGKGGGQAVGKGKSKEDLVKQERLRREKVDAQFIKDQERKIKFEKAKQAEMDRQKKFKEKWKGKEIPERNRLAEEKRVQAFKVKEEQEKARQAKADLKKQKEERKRKEFEQRMKGLDETPDAPKTQAPEGKGRSLGKRVLGKAGDMVKGGGKIGLAYGAIKFVLDPPSLQDIQQSFETALEKPEETMKSLLVGLGGLAGTIGGAAITGAATFGVGGAAGGLLGGMAGEELGRALGDYLFDSNELSKKSAGVHANAAQAQQSNMIMMQQAAQGQFQREQNLPPVQLNSHTVLQLDSEVIDRRVSTQFADMGKLAISATSSTVRG